MSKYITELANDIAKSCPDLVENGCGNDNCVACLAFKLIGLGYQKQEWISVDERLPEDVYGRDRKKITVLVCTKSGRVSTSSRVRMMRFNKEKLDYEYTDIFEWSGYFSKKVTHWMPLPEAPKMKGGAE